MVSGIQFWCLGVVSLRGVFGVQMWDTGYIWVDCWHWVSRYAAEHLYPESDPPNIVHFMFVQLKHSCHIVGKGARGIDGGFPRLDSPMCLPISGQQKYERPRGAAFAGLGLS